MKYDQFGRPITSESELCDLLYRNPNLKLDLFYVIPEKAATYNKSIDLTFAEFEKTKNSLDAISTTNIEEFDSTNQLNWYMPDEYKNMDIAEYLIGLCKTDVELQRVGDELLLYQDRNLFNLLKYLKFFVDTMRANNVVWGLGRGSSTSSYILYLLGVHKINSLKYDLDIKEFLK